MTKNSLPNDGTSGEGAEQASGYGHLIKPIREHDDGLLLSEIKAMRTCSNSLCCFRDAKLG